MPGIAEELFVESDKLPIRLFCSICLDVAETAIITQCDHLFCSECIQQLQDANGTNCECPNCRKSILPITPATNARNFLSQQIVYCSEIDSLRCGWEGKYSMWHTHKAKYCKKASKSDKASAKNANVSEIGNLSKAELSTMSVGRLRKILQEYIKLNRNKLTDDELRQDFNYKQFIEKMEYISAIIKFESIYGVSGQFKKHSPSKNSANIDTAEQEFPTTYDGLKRLKIRELSSYLRSENIDPSSSEFNCIEKSDLINLVLRTQKHYRDIINGNAYDPKLEKQQFSPPQPQPPQTPPVEQKDAAFGYDEIKQDAAQRPTAYSFNSDHLRRSSINRIDVNAMNDNNEYIAPNTTYSHVYNNHQHTTNINRNGLDRNGDNYGAMPQSARRNNDNQRMYNEANININNYNNYSVHSHSHSHHQPPQRQPQPPPPTAMNMPQMPPMPPMPRWFGNMAQMPEMSNIYNNARDTMNSVFGTNSNNNCNHNQ